MHFEDKAVTDYKEKVKKWMNEVGRLPIDINTLKEKHLHDTIEDLDSYDTKYKEQVYKAFDKGLPKDVPYFIGLVESDNGEDSFMTIYCFDILLATISSFLGGILIDESIKRGDGRFITRFYKYTTFGPFVLQENDDWAHIWGCVDNDTKERVLLFSGNPQTARAYLARSRATHHLYNGYMDSYDPARPWTWKNGNTFKHHDKAQAVEVFTDPVLEGYEKREEPDSTFYDRRLDLPLDTENTGMDIHEPIQRSKE